ncbi:cytochrome-c peroxidase [Tundrisphaera lichenicola]|uniref:cytochrome-c peroxidase n=1 Tax=Tundrisphaera lichenicola TaxID=2029860 RepID=UPI003EB857D0
MPRLSSVLATLIASTPILLVGCGGAGTETASPIASNSQTPAPPVEGSKGGQKPAELTTPDTRVDPNKVVDVVKGEVRGGESESPTPMAYLYQDFDPKTIQDEAFAVEVPNGLQDITSFIPASNPITKGKVELGKQLYFDPRISKDGTVSCATCHDPAKGWTDNLKTSSGIKGQKGGRNAPTVINTVYGKTMFWDGRAPSLEGQAQGPIQNKIEMGDQSYKEIIERLRTIPGYKEQFLKVFGTEATLDGMAKAIASFERTALSGNSTYDKYLRSDPDEPESFKVMSESEKRGMVLFGLPLTEEDPYKVDKALLKKANCTACHAGFNFTDEQFHNLGVGYDEAKGEFADRGRFEISPIGAKAPQERGAFKTPTVRDITRTGPYMHDGSEKTLEEIIEFYNKGGVKNPALDPEMKPLNLTDSEKADLVAFMKALTGETVEVALPTLPPGPDGKTVDPASALMSPAPNTTAVDLREVHCSVIAR